MSCSSLASTEGGGVEVVAGPNHIRGSEPSGVLVLTGDRESSASDTFRPSPSGATHVRLSSFGAYSVLGQEHFRADLAATLDGGIRKLWHGGARGRAPDPSGRRIGYELCDPQRN